MEASQHSLLGACLTLHSINATLAIVPQHGAGLWIALTHAPPWPVYYHYRQLFFKGEGETSGSTALPWPQMPVVGKCEERLSCASTSTKERCILNNLLAIFQNSVICNLQFLWNIWYPHPQTGWHWNLNPCQFLRLSTFLHDYGLKTKLRGLSPQANYTDWATAAVGKVVPTFAGRGVLRG
jgi:hypothetical protein